MTQAVAKILDEAAHLSVSERADLADQIIGRFAQEIPAEIEAAHLAEVRRRVSEVESGAVSLIPGEEALARIREMVASASTKA